MSVSAKVQLKLTVAETLALAALNSGGNVVSHGAYNLDTTLTSTSTVPATHVASFSLVMTAGAATIDLTALDGTEGAIDGSGKKVQAVLFHNPSSNANAITIKEGASNGYSLLGASWQIILQPGQRAMFALEDSAPDIAGGDKTIDIAGTLTQALNVSLVIG